MLVTTKRILRTLPPTAGLALLLALAGCAPADAPLEPGVAAVAKAMGAEDGRADVAKLMADQPLPDVVVGRADAPVTIVEYASMTCDHCAAFHREVLPDLKRALIDTGKAKLILREFPFDPAATAAAMLARCAPGGKRTETVDLLYARAGEWVHAAEPGQALMAVAKDAGFDAASFKACLADAGLQAKVVAVKERAVSEFGVRATPTFFVDGVKVEGGRPAEMIGNLVDAVIASAQKGAAL